MICSKCHTVNDDGSLFCRCCGKSLTKQSSKRTSSRILIFILLIAFVVGGIILLVDHNIDSTYSYDYSNGHVETSDTYTVSSESNTTEEYVNEPTVDELYSQAETIHDLRCLADRGYLPAAFDLVSIFYRDDRYEECSQYAYQCIDANYRVNEVWETLGELPACYWRREYEE